MLNKIPKQGKGELAFAGSLVLLSLIVAWDTSRMDVPQGASIVSPRTVPYMVAALVFSVGIALIVEVLRGRLGIPEGTEPDDAFVPADRKTMLFLLIAIGVHVLLLEKAGYIIAATLGFWGVSFTFGSRKPVKDFAISAIFALAVYFIFSKGLQIQLPKGFLESVLPK
jgi:putative tricarboxylic transport membrane protein